MSNRLYKRGVVVTLARPVDTSTYFLLQPNAVVIQNLRVKFSMEKSLDKDPNSGTVTLYNLADRTRSETVKKPLHVRVDAGYDDNLLRVFSGDLVWSQSRKEDVSWVTELQVGDGHRAYKHARFSQSFKKGASKKNILKSVAASMGLKVPKNAEEATALGKRFISGEVFEGPSRKSLDKILSPAGYRWSIQNGNLRVARNGEANARSKHQVNETSGLLGVPEMGAPTRPGEKPVLVVKTLLNPAVNPGDLIELKSKEIGGTFLITRVVHEGDTHGAEWYSTLEGHAY